MSMVMIKGMRSKTDLTILCVQATMSVIFFDALTWNYMNKNFNVAEMKQPNTLGK